MIAEQTVYRVYPSIVAPVLLGLAAVYFAVTKDLWMLAALPFIALGSVCSAPNLNLADGFLVVVSALIGLVLSCIFEPLGVAILAGSAAGWLGGAVEKRIRMKPDPEFNRAKDTRPKAGDVKDASCTETRPGDAILDSRLRRDDQST